MDDYETMLIYKRTGTSVIPYYYKVLTIKSERKGNDNT